MLPRPIAAVLVVMAACAADVDAPTPDAPPPSFTAQATLVTGGWEAQVDGVVLPEDDGGAEHVSMTFASLDEALGQEVEVVVRNGAAVITTFPLMPGYSCQFFCGEDGSLCAGTWPPVREHRDVFFDPDGTVRGGCVECMGTVGGIEACP